MPYSDASGSKTASPFVHSATDRMLDGRNGSISRREKRAWPSRYMPSRDALVCTTTMSLPLSSTEPASRISNGPPGIMTASTRRAPFSGPPLTAGNSSIRVPPMHFQYCLVMGVSFLLILFSGRPVCRTRECIDECDSSTVLWQSLGTSVHRFSRAFIRGQQGGWDNHGAAARASRCSGSRRGPRQPRIPGAPSNQLCE